MCDSPYTQSQPTVAFPCLGPTNEAHMVTIYRPSQRDRPCPNSFINELIVSLVLAFRCCRQLRHWQRGVNVGMGVLEMPVVWAHRVGGRRSA